MITPFDIYLIGLMDSIGNLCSIGIVLGIIFCIACTVTGIVAQFDCAEEWVKASKKYAEISFLVVVSVSIVGALLPSSKTLAAMYVMPSVIKSVQDSKQIQQIPQAVLDLIKSYERKDGDKS